MKPKYDRLYLVDQFELLGLDNTKARRAAEVATGIREELEDMMTDVQKNLIKEQRREFDQFSQSMEKRMQKDNRNTIISILLGCTAIAASILIATFH